MTYSFIKNVILAEGSRPEKVAILPLPYGTNDLAPAISRSTIEYHFEKLAKTYAKRYNAGEGDAKFNEAGVYLHNILFQQYKEPTPGNKPSDQVLELIEKHFTSFENFKKEFLKTAMAIQGSGWVYLAKDARLNTYNFKKMYSDSLKKWEAINRRYNTRNKFESVMFNRLYNS